MFDRFDSELSMAHEDAREEKATRERLQRERDELMANQYTHQQTIQVWGLSLFFAIILTCSHAFF